MTSFRFGLAAVSILAAPAAYAQTVQDVATVSLPASGLGEALLALSAQTGVPIVFRTEDIDGFRSSALSGRHTALEAARRLIGEAPLDIRVIGGSGLAVVRIEKAPARSPPPVSRPPAVDPYEIVVVGNLLVRRSALERKESAEIVLDALGADELGQLPDRNAGESVDRLAGVSMLVEKGEGRYIQVRGVEASLNGLTLNGLPIGSPEAELGGRQSPLDMFSGGVLNGVEVRKIHLPDEDAQGIGGVVDLKTKQPFDQPGDFFADLSFRAGFEETRPAAQAFGGRDPWAVSATVAGKVSDGSLGWLVSGAWSDREYVSQGVYQDDWRVVDGEALPSNVKNNYYVIGRQRLNIDATVEKRFEDGSLSANVFHAGWKEFQHRLRFEQGLAEAVSVTGPGTGLSGPDHATTALRLEKASKSLTVLALRGRREAERTTVDGYAQFNRNTLEEPFQNWEFRSNDVFGPTAWRIDDDNVASLSPNAASPSYSDASQFGFRRLRLFDRTMAENSVRGGAKLTHDLGGPAAVVLEAGGSAARTDRELDEGAEQYGPGPDLPTLASAPPSTRSGFINRFAGVAAPNFWLDAGALGQWFDEGADETAFQRDPETSFLNDYAADYRVTETVLAGYATVRARAGPVEAIAGVRMEAATISASGFLVAGSRPLPREQDGEYHNVLPSLAVNYRPAPGVTVRASATSSLARAPFDLIYAPSAIEVDGASASVSLGQAGLRPRVADNYDLSVQWRPSPLTLISASVFRKEIDHDPLFSTFVFDGAEDVARAFQSFDLPADMAPGIARLEITGPFGEGQSRLQGVEFDLQTQLDFLPSPFDGLGGAASLSLLDGESRGPSGRTPLKGQPDLTYAATAFYQKGPVDAFVSYSYNGSYVTDLDPRVRLDQGEFGRWDARVSWAVSDRIKLFLEGVNLNNEPTTEFQDGVTDWNTEYEYVGRTYYAGAVYRF